MGSKEDLPGSDFQPLYEIVSGAMQQGDLDGFLALLVLQSPFTHAACCPWRDVAKELLSRAEYPVLLRRPHDVAVAGIALALGERSQHLTGFAAAAAQELARQPMPPAACVRDDERLLLGLSAGIGAAATALGPTLLNLLSLRAPTSSPRQRILDLWAEGLSLGEPRLTADLAARLMRYLQALPDDHAAPTDGDRIAIFWAAARLLDAPWKPVDEDIGKLDAILSGGRRAFQVLVVKQRPSTLDAALLLDALSTAPRHRLARLTSLESLMRIIDQFPASVHVLQNRQRGKSPYVMNDEYDAQDLLRAVALGVLPDLVPEDPASKVAGKSSRLDFTCRSARVGVEVKYLRSLGDWERVREEVLVDEATYQMHPYVETVVVLIHDPHNHVSPEHRPFLEADLSQSVAVFGRTVKYITRIR